MVVLWPHLADYSPGTEPQWSARQFSLGSDWHLPGRGWGCCARSWLLISHLLPDIPGTVGRGSCEVDQAPATNHLLDASGPHGGSVDVLSGFIRAIKNRYLHRGWMMAVGLATVGAVHLHDSFFPIGYQVRHCPGAFAGSNRYGDGCGHTRSVAACPRCGAAGPRSRSGSEEAGRFSSGWNGSTCLLWMPVRHKEGSILPWLSGNGDLTQIGDLLCSCRVGCLPRRKLEVGDLLKDDLWQIRGLRFQFGVLR